MPSGWCRRRRATGWPFRGNDVADAGLPSAVTGGRARGPGWMARLVASPAFQDWAARFPLTRGMVRRDGAALFDIVAGFCHSQALFAFVAFGMPDRLMQGPATTESLALRAAVPPERMAVLLRAAASLGLVRERRGLWHIARRGAALAGVPGLQGMIRHHAVLYRDLSDPVAFFRGEVQTELADFWPYVFGAGAAADPAQAAAYSRLMAKSQALVAADTLATVDLRGVRVLMDVGGGSGAFLAAALRAAPAVQGVLFDLPAVVPAASERLGAPDLAGRVRIVPGSFRDDPLPGGADAISLVRVLYDHADTTVRALLGAVRAALPPGGRLIVSEPMTGGAAPERAGDAYFALYCMAMRTGRARSQDEIAGLLAEAGFTAIRTPAARRPFVTSVVEAVNQS